MILNISAKMIFQAARGILFCMIAFSAAVLGHLFMLFPFLPLLLFPPIIKPTLFRKIVDTMIWFWESLLAGLLDHVAGIKCVITGDPIRPDDHCLFVMNHRTRLDWMFFWQCLFKLKAIKHERVILKSELKHIPGPGWSMQFGLFVFLQRKWEMDKLILIKILDHFKDIGQKAQLLLFPEGTDLTAYTKSRSDAFAEKNGLPKYDFVLHPRTTGFTFLAQHMKKNKTLDSIYDISIGYPVNIPKNELSLPLGNFPKEVHYHIRRYPINDLPETEQGLVDWCQDIWREKETKLKKFYEDKSFNEPCIVEPDSSRVLSFVAVVSWLLLMFLQVWTIYALSFVRYYCLFAIIVMVVIDRKFGGLDNFQIDVHNRLFLSKKE